MLDSSTSYLYRAQVCINIGNEISEYHFIILMHFTEMKSIVAHSNRCSAYFSSNSIMQWFPTFFCPTGHLFYFGEHGGHKVKFFTSPPLFSPPFQQLWGLGERCKLPQRGLGRSPSRQRIFEHSMAKSDRFDMLRQIFQRSKQHEIFDFHQELVIFTITGITAHTLPAYPVKMGNFTVSAHIF